MQPEITSIEIKLPDGAVEKIREATGLDVITFQIDAVDDKGSIFDSRLENIKVL